MDIFISYASEDRERAKLLAQALEQVGFSVWWDRKIPLGKAFDEVIEEHLSAAGCVLVLWTQQSTDSRWVRAEASEAAARGVLIPLLLEPNIKIPLEFKLLQAADLSAWDGDAGQAEFQAVATSIKSMLSPKGTVASVGDDDPFQARLTSPAATRRPALSRRHWLREINLLMVLPTAAIAAAVAAAMQWRLPTAIQADLLVDRIAFSIEGEHSAQLPPDPLSFSLLSVENFDELRFTPRALTRIASTGTAVPVRIGRDEAIVVKAVASAEPLLILERPASASGSSGRLQSLNAKAGTHVILQTRPGKPARLGIRLDGDDLDTNVLPTDQLEVTLRNVTATGVLSGSTMDEPVTLRVALAATQPLMELRGTRRWFAIAADLEPSQNVELLRALPVGGPEFQRQRADGQLESAVAEGSVRYTSHSGIEPLTLKQGDFLHIGEPERVVIERLQMRADGSGMDVRLAGRFRQIALTSGAQTHDLRLTAFQAVWHNAQLVVLFSVAAWALSVCAGAYRLYRDLEPAS